MARLMTIEEKKARGVLKENTKDEKSSKKKVYSDEPVFNVDDGVYYPSYMSCLDLD